MVSLGKLRDQPRAANYSGDGVAVNFIARAILSGMIAG